MGIQRQLLGKLVKQFHNPTGPVGQIAGWVMSHRSSNVRRSQWAVELLDVKPAERVIELGCGPGVAIQALATRATAGLVVGVDHSKVMIRQARKRNSVAVDAGQVRLVHAEIGRLEVKDGPFDAALAVNTIGFWPQPTDRLREIRRLMKGGGRIALVSQPRCRGATAETTAKATEELAALLTGAGFEDLRVETLALHPPVGCVLATVP